MTTVPLEPLERPPAPAPVKRRSAVALMDALGFRDIWKGTDHARTVGTLERVRDLISTLKDSVENSGIFHYYACGEVKLSVGWFSDTIAIVAQAIRSPDAMPENLQLTKCLINVVAMCVGYVIREAAERDPPMVFRGALTIGDAYVYGDNIWVGPAISEAASLYEKADGAFVFLSPKAAGVPYDDIDFADALVEYDVPLKAKRGSRGPKHVRTLVVSPFTHVVPNSNAGFPIRAGIERAMESRRRDVRRKKRNTMNFLDHVIAMSPYAHPHGVAPSG